MSSKDDVLVALRVLRAGVPGQHPAIDDDTISLWSAALVGYSGEVLVEAAQTWVEDHGEFPSMSSFVAEVQRVAREHASKRRQRELPMGWIGDQDGNARCAECGGSDFVEAPDPNHPGKVFVRPCSVCDPEGYEMWVGGHFNPDHDRHACSLERCRKAAPGRSRR